MIFICVGIVVLSGLAGGIYANKFINKYKFFSELVNFCSYLEININFSQDKLPIIFQNFIDEKKSLFKSLLSEFKKLKFEARLDNFEIKKRITLPDFLNKEQKQEITNFLLSLGEVDVFNEVNSIKNYKLKFQNFKDNALAEKNKTAPLAYKLSIGIGLVLAIIIF